jgi:hypothetical protein
VSAPDEALDELVHDVNDKCSSLKKAAALMRDASEQDRSELLTLMVGQAESLAQAIAGFEKSRRR